jgi:hypothetical protein
MDKNMKSKEKLASPVVQPGCDKQTGLVLSRTADVGLTHRDSKFQVSQYLHSL